MRFAKAQVQNYFLNKTFFVFQCSVSEEVPDPYLIAAANNSLKRLATFEFVQNEIHKEKYGEGNEDIMAWVDFARANMLLEFCHYVSSGI